MAQLLVWIFFCFGFGCCRFPLYKYYYVDTRVDFATAQAYCREYYKDVATITSSQDMSVMVRPSTNQDGVWIGLNDDPTDWMGVMGNNSNSWRWSLTGQTSNNTYCNWQPGQPDFSGAIDMCVVINPYGQWADVNCKSYYRSICSAKNATGKLLLMLVQTVLTWTQAQTYCRQNGMDLATMENANDANVIAAVASGYYTWMGLYRVPWFWSDHNTSTFRNFAAGKPDNNQQVNFCVAELPNHTWIDTPCSTSLTFFCYQESRLRTLLSIRSQTNAVMTDSAINAQILQQIRAALENQGGTVFEIKWNIQPQKV